MRILFVNRELPYPADTGGRIRAHALLRQLARRHTVSLIAFGDGDPEAVAALRQFCADVVTVPLAERQRRENKRKYQLLSLFSPRPYQYVAHYSPRMQAAIDAYLAANRVDLVHVEFAQMGYYRLPPTVPAVLDEHNVEYEILQRTYAATPPSPRKLYAYSEYRKFRRDELSICARFDACLTTSERDKAVLARAVSRTPFHVIPNGVDTAAYRPLAQPDAAEKALLFTGTIDYYPNIDGLHFFMDQVFPLVRARVPEARFYIVGKDPPPQISRYAAAPGVTVTGYVQDVRPYYEKAAVVVVPLRVGGGTRLKIVEALALGKPVVSTTIGAEGIEVTDGENVLLADDAEAMARSIVRLLEDRSLRERLGRAGRRLAEERYDWNVIGDRLDRVYRELIGLPHGAGSGVPA